MLQVVVTAGVAIASYGEINFVVIGVVLQLISVMTESTRLTMVQILLQACPFSHLSLLSGLQHCHQESVHARNLRRRISILHWELGKANPCGQTVHQVSTEGSTRRLDTIQSVIVVCMTYRGIQEPYGGVSESFRQCYQHSRTLQRQGSVKWRQLLRNAALVSCFYCVCLGVLSAHVDRKSWK